MFFHVELTACRRRSSIDLVRSPGNSSRQVDNAAVVVTLRENVQAEPSQSTTAARGL